MVKIMVKPFRKNTSFLRLNFAIRKKCDTTKFYTPYDQLPLMHSIVEVAKFLVISQTNAYVLIHTAGFLEILFGKRIVIPKDKLLEWLNNQIA